MYYFYINVRYLKFLKFKYAYKIVNIDLAEIYPFQIDHKNVKNFFFLNKIPFMYGNKKVNFTRYGFNSETEVIEKFKNNDYRELICSTKYEIEQYQILKLLNNL